MRSDKMKIGIGSYYLNEYGIEEGARIMAEHGYDAIDLPFANTESEFYSSKEDNFFALCGKYLTALKKCGIEISQIHGPWRYPPKDSTEDDRAERFGKMAKSIAIAKHLGAKYVAIHPLMPYGAESAEKPDEVYEINKKFYTALASVAEKLGVTVCLENMWADKGGRIFDSSCSDPYEACDYIDTLNDMAGEELFAFCFDVGHANICGRHMQNTLRILGKRVKTLHIHDTDGERDNHAIPYSFSSASSKPFTDYEGFLAGLHDIGYKGALNFEVCYAFNSFPKATHPALFRLISSIGDYFKSKINIQ
jgi:sugar phosphate isomerase/epimerase